MNRNDSMQSIPFLVLASAESAKVEAERLAHDTEGVRRMINFIKVGDPT
jgi:hypothetical protein